MMLVTISIAIILNPTFVTAQSCDDSIRPPACGLIHEDAWIPMQNAYQQIQNAISDHDDRLIQHHIAINTAIGNIGNIGDITQHDADIKAAITTHGAAIVLILLMVLLLNMMLILKQFCYYYTWRSY
eukprot:473257_1